MHTYNDEYDEALRYVKHKFEVIRIAKIVIYFDGDDSFFPLYDPMDNFPWYDIALSMTEFPECVQLDYDDCPVCGNRRIKLKFVPYDERVKQVEGNILICQHCQSHFGLKELLCS